MRLLKQPAASLYFHRKVTEICLKHNQQRLSLPELKDECKYLHEWQSYQRLIFKAFSIWLSKEQHQRVISSHGSSRRHIWLSTSGVSSPPDLISLCEWHIEMSCSFSFKSLHHGWHDTVTLSSAGPAQLSCFFFHLMSSKLHPCRVVGGRLDVPSLYRGPAGKKWILLLWR